MITLWLLATACTRATPPEDFGPAPTISLVDQRGAPFTSAQLAGRVSVVDFIFTRCTEQCPRLSAELMTLSHELPSEAGGAPLQLLSISVDPEFDRPDVLAQYARAFGEHPLPWSLLTGERAEVDAVIAGFQQGLERSADGAGVPSILHSERFVLVDGAAHIRGFFPVMEDRDALLQAVRGLDDGAP